MERLDKCLILLILAVLFALNWQVNFLRSDVGYMKEALERIRAKVFEEESHIEIEKWKKKRGLKEEEGDCLCLSYHVQPR